VHEGWAMSAMKTWDTNAYGPMPPGGAIRCPLNGHFLRCSFHTDAGWAKYQQRRELADAPYSVRPPPGSLSPPSYSLGKLMCSRGGMSQVILAPWAPNHLFARFPLCIFIYRNPCPPPPYKQKSLSYPPPLHGPSGSRFPPESLARG